MRHRGLAALAGTLLIVAFAPAAAGADTGVGTAPGEGSPSAAGPRLRADDRPGAERPGRLAAPASPGAAGIGDPYFPLEGNGGYDVRHYDLTFSYDPATDRLDAVNRSARWRRRPVALRPRPPAARRQRGRRSTASRATFTRDGQELQITPHKQLPARASDVRRRASRYGGVPQTIVGSPIVFGSPYGFVHTDDGAFMGDEPNAASTWFPINDHPADKATWTFRVDRPRRPRASSPTASCVSQRTRNGKSTVRLGRAVPDGELPRHGRHRQLGRPDRAARPAASPRPSRSTRRCRAVNGQTRGRLLLRHDGRGHRPVERRPSARTRSTRPARSPTTRPTTARRSASRWRRRPGRCTRRCAATITIAHELAHQWFGDSVSVRDVAQHLAQRGLRDVRRSTCGTSTRASARAHESFLDDYARPATSAFWTIMVGRPAARHDVRQRRLPPRRHDAPGAAREDRRRRRSSASCATGPPSTRHGNGTTEQFIALAQRISGQDLGAFFQTWLYTTAKPTTW